MKLLHMDNTGFEAVISFPIISFGMSPKDNRMLETHESMHSIHAHSLSSDKTEPSNLQVLYSAHS